MKVENRCCCYKLKNGQCGLDKLCKRKHLKNNKCFPLRDYIDKSFIYSDKSAQKSAQVFKKEYSKLLREAKIRNRMPNLKLRNNIDDLFKVSKKSAKESAKVFQIQYKKFLKEAQLRNAEPDLTIRNAIDNSFKISEKSAKDSAEVFVENFKESKNKIKDFLFFKSGRKFIKNNKKTFGIATAVGIILFSLLPIKKTNENSNKRNKTEYMEKSAYSKKGKESTYTVNLKYPSGSIQPIKVKYLDKPVYPPKSSYEIKTIYSIKTSYSAKIIEVTDTITPVEKSTTEIIYYTNDNPAW